MSNSVYSSARTLFLNGDLSWTRSNIKVCFLSNTYVGASGTTIHSKYSDIASYVLSGTVNVRSLTSKSLEPNGIKGAGTAANVQFTAINSGQVIGFILIFADTANTIDGPPASPSTAPLIALIDAGYGLGAGTNSGDLLITWPTTHGIVEF